MADHHELVAELPVLEQMGTQERQKLAKKRRLQQLKKWSQREKEWIAKEKQLNKRLANKYQEENNGLSLKQYTTYNSNQRTKKRSLMSTKGTTIDEIGKSATNGKFTSRTDSSARLNNNNDHDLHNNNNHIDNIRLRSAKSIIEAKSSISRSKVHFNNGIMLIEAAARNDYDDVKRLLMLGVSPDSVNHDGLTALHQCCIDASEPIMTLLIEFGANVNAKDTEQWTPLHAACTCGHPNLVDILVTNGADLLAVNGDGNLPLDICDDEQTLDYLESQMVKQGITQEVIDLTRASKEATMLKDLERAVADGVDLDMADEQGVTALHIAAANNYISVVKFLLKQNVNVEACDNDLWQPIHGASCWGNEQYYNMIELLVESGANLNSKTICDETVFELCDNMELLSKLNQLKDEIEEKKSTNTNQLKRSQSKSNSRILSVRRTSVRDKNQISRREARQEALLRTEGRLDTIDGIHINATNASPEMSSITQIKSTSTVDGDLTGSILTDPQTTEIKTETETSRVDDSSLSNDRSIDNLTGPNGFRPSLKKQEPVDVLVSKGSNSTSDDAHQRSSRSVQDQINGTSHSVSNSSHSLISGNQENDEDEVSEAHRSMKQIETICDPTPKELQKQSQPTIIQFAPTNYTLSNLKKQRSDMRMRTSSMGTSSQDAGGDGSSFVTVKHHVTLDINPMGGQYSKSSEGLLANGPVNSGATNRRPKSKTGSLNVLANGNQLARSQSPSSTFRKFSGEPSDTTIDFSRKNRHRCCIVM